MTDPKTFFIGNCPIVNNRHFMINISINFIFTSRHNNINEREAIDERQNKYPHIIRVNIITTTQAPADV